MMKEITNKYSFGVGDRFGRQGEAQLSAFKKAQEAGVTITPVWNKSFREHKTVGSEPDAVRQEADEAVSNLNWQSGYLVDADHITLETVPKFSGRFNKGVDYSGSVDAFAKVMVLEIDKSKLPSGEEGECLSGEQFARMIIHNPNDPEFSPHVRQLLHTAYKIAYENSDRFMSELERNKAIIEKNVTKNIFQRHVKPLYLD